MNTAEQRHVNGGRIQLSDAPNLTNALALCIMTLLYAPFVALTVSRPLWHDELFTFYMSKFSSLTVLINEIRHIDLNPPVLYLATRASFSIFGDSEFATRLPDVLAFWVASGCVLVFVARRLGAWYGLLAVVVFWSSNSLSLATEARPYALLLMFFGIAMLCWQEVVLRSRYRTLGLLVLPWALVGMIATHCFSVFYFLPFACAELARPIESKRLELVLWSEFVLSACTTFFYLPILNRLSATVFPREFSASLHKILSFYKLMAAATGPAMLLAAFAVLCFIMLRGRPSKTNTTKPTYADFGLVLGLLLIPIAIDLVLMRSHAPFWPRYAVGSAFAFGIGFAWLIALYTRRATMAALLAAVIVFAIASFHAKRQLSESTASTVKPASLEALRPGLPIVAASGLAFLEIDHYGSDALDSRLFYLTDPVASIHYAHANLFEGMGELKQYFPIRANVASYSSFLPGHPKFLVFGIVGYPEDWLIPKLKSDGAKLTSVRQYPGPWGFRITVFEVETRSCCK